MNKYDVVVSGKKIGNVYAKSYSDAFFKCDLKYGESVATKADFIRNKQTEEDNER